MKIKGKFLSLAIILTALVSAAILISNILLFSENVGDNTAEKVDTAAKVASNVLYSLESEAGIISLSLAENEFVRRAIENNDRTSLHAAVNAVLSMTQTDFCTVTDPNGIVILRTHSPENYGDSVADQANIQAAMQGNSLTAIEEGTIVRMSVRSGRPVFNDQGNVVGTVSVGYRLDTEEFVDNIKNITGCEATVFLGDVRISTTIQNSMGDRAVGTEAGTYVSEVVLNGENYTGEADILGRRAIVSYSPIIGSGKQIIGMLFSGQYLDEVNSTIGAFIRRGTVIALLILAVFLVVIFIMADRVAKPIDVMTKAALALAVGETDIEISVNTNDETRLLADAFNKMLDNTRHQVGVLGRMAHGDLSGTLKMRSKNDVMNQSLDELNQTLQTQAKALEEEHKRIRLLLDATPLACRLWNREMELLECNEASVRMFELRDKEEYARRYFELSPKYQPDGEESREKTERMIRETFAEGRRTYTGMYRKLDGTPIPCEVTMERVPYAGDYVVAAYSRDLREQQKMTAEIEQRDRLLQTVNEAADILLRSDSEEFSAILLECMGMMAKATNTSSMYIVKNQSREGAVYREKVYGWPAGVMRSEGEDITVYIASDRGRREYREPMLRGESANIRVRDMKSKRDRERLAGQGIESVLLVPLFIREDFWGFVGFNSGKEHLFTENEVSIMRSGSMLMANAILRNEQVFRIRETTEKLGIALEDAKEANNAKSRFLSQVSHEIRTPLNAVIGLSELALDEARLDRESKGKLEKIYSAGATILNIVNDILDLSKIEAGKFDLSVTRYDTPSMINDTAALNVVRIGEKAITFKLRVDEKLPCALLGDDLRVKQVFNNLLSNAFKYTNAGEVVWSVTFERDGGDIWLLSEVSDTGVGIREENIGKLFSDFSRLDIQANRLVGGTGLGLSITKHLVEMMDGTIEVESEYGKGTVFRVRMRQQAVTEQSIGKTVADNLMKMRYTLSRRETNKKRQRLNMSYASVLVVDDIETNLDVVKGLLRPYRLQVDCALNGAQAVEMIRKGTPRYSAVFMDHMMPGMDGIETTRVIREEIGTAYAREVPVIALTANAIIGNEGMFLSKGFQAFISKPIDTAKLDSILRSYVRDKEKEEEAFPTRTEKGKDDGALQGWKERGIRGIRVKELLKRFGNDAEAVRDVLRSYAENTEQLLEKLQEDCSAGELRGLAVTAHGIKGASYGICAQGIGAKAEALEQAANREDQEAVRALLPTFAKQTRKLTGEILETLNALERARKKPMAAAPPRALLQELRDACSAFDMDRVDAAMNEIESCRYQQGEELVLWLRRQVADMNFEKISDLSAWPQL